ncbi:MAG TPA: nucleotidyltransferase domain-containing protein [Thermoanaerobaculia bacterium]|nr:nucleotidyltransferase domain-containing protein [Thermoanaerobaculia bacterium]
MAAIAIEIDKARLRDFCRRWKITEFALFGSVTRPEEFRADSDVDVLVRFAPDAKWSLFDFVRAHDELAEIFGRKVDLVEREMVEESTNRFRKRSILRSVVLLDVA